jgi:hypothetical protein
MKTSYLLIGIAAATLSFSACEKNEIDSAQALSQEYAVTSDSSEVKVTLMQLPQSVQLYLNTNFKGFVLKEAEKNTNDKGIVTYETKITLADKTIELKFDAEGKLIVKPINAPKSTPVLEADLLAAIKLYLKEKHAGYTFISAEKYTVSVLSFYEVKIKTAAGNMSLKFDDKGAIIVKAKEVEEVKTSQILEANLVDAIKVYLKENHAGYTFVSAEKDTKGALAIYKVKIKTATGMVELVFDAAGKIIVKVEEGKSELNIAEKDLLPAIVTYLKTNHAGYSIVQAKKSVKAAITTYELKIKVSTGMVELKFDDKGKMLSTSKPEIKPAAGEIKLANLATSIKSYLATNYVGYTFVSANTKANDKKENITNVVIKVKTVTYELKFNAKNEFMSVNGDNKTSLEMVIKLTDLPAEAQAYLTKTFPVMVMHNAKKETKAGVVTYIVKLTADKKSYEITFDAKGKFLSQKKS